MTALYDHHGQLLARFQRLILERQDGIFIENMTDCAIFYAGIKNHLFSRLPSCQARG